MCHVRRARLVLIQTRCLLCFAADQVRVMVEKYHVYMLSNGRISMAGVTTKNVDYIVDAMHDAIAAHPTPSE